MEDPVASFVEKEHTSFDCGRISFDEARRLHHPEAIEQSVYVIGNGQGYIVNLYARVYTPLETLPSLGGRGNVCFGVYGGNNALIGVS